MSVFNQLIAKRWLAKRDTSQDAATSIGVAVQIAKVDQPSKFFLGWASVSSIDGKPVTDLQGDLISDEELEDAANTFMRQSRVGKLMHKGNLCIDYTQSLMLTPAVKQALGITMKPDKTGWLVGGFCRDLKTWERIRDGELRSLSIGGTGTRVPVEPSPSIAKEHTLRASERIRDALIEKGLIARPADYHPVAKRTSRLREAVERLVKQESAMAGDRVLKTGGPAERMRRLLVAKGLVR